MVMNFSTNRPRFPHAIVSLLLISALLYPSTVSSQSQGDGCLQPAFVHELWNPRRFLSVSTSAPVAEYYRKNESEAQKLRPVFKLLNQLVGIMDSRRKDPNSELGCNLHKETDWVQTMRDAAQKREIIASKGGIDDSCPSRLDYSRDGAQEKLDLSQDVKGMLQEAVLSMKPAFLKSRASPLISKLTNWTSEVYPLTDWDLRRLSQQCDLQTVSAFRVDGELFLRIIVTNHPVDDFVLDYNRQVLEEWVAEKFSSSLKMTHPAWVPASFTVDLGGHFELSTTLLEKWSSRAGLASHGTMFMDDNPAIDEALRQNSVAIDLAEDAIALSNIAILALPLTMNLIPVAFLAELSTCAMVAYIIFTDVFSTLPFLIKGMELIRAVDLERRETVAYYVGNQTFGEIQTWSASCKGEDKFRAIGVSFVVIALVAIVVGISLELFAGIAMRRKRRKEGSAAEGPFGRAAFDSTKLSLLGSGTDKDGLERRYSIDADEIQEASDTETRPSSQESTTERNAWWKWGSKHATHKNASVLMVMPSAESDVLSSDLMSRSGAFFSDEKEPERGTSWSGSRLVNELKRLFGFLGGGGNNENEGFSVGVGSDGMSSAERAAREIGCDGYVYEYDEESGEGERGKNMSSF